MSHNSKGIFGKGVPAKVGLWHGHTEKQTGGQIHRRFFNRAHMLFYTHE